MIDADTKRDIEEYKRQLKHIEEEETQILKDLDLCRARKKDIIDRIKVLSDDVKYQEDMLAMVYQQRRGKQDSSKE